MRIVVTGNGKAGSWKIRGEQLGAAIGAEVIPNAERADLSGAGLVIVVKRTPPALIQHLRSLRKPWVWDALDCWPQPHGNEWGHAGAVKWLRATIADLRPTAMVFATDRMRFDAEFAGPSLVLPHHYRPGLTAAPVRDQVQTVVYEGGEHYLGRWRAAIESECQARGWTFLVNPPDIRAGDIGIAVRDVAGYPAVSWKSAVKLANIQAAGIPAVCTFERGYQEQQNGTESWVLKPEDLSRAFESLCTASVRRSLQAGRHRSPPSIETIAAQYREWLRSLS